LALTFVLKVSDVNEFHNYQKQPLRYNM